MTFSGLPEKKSGNKPGIVSALIIMMLTAVFVSAASLPVSAMTLTDDGTVLPEGVLTGSSVPTILTTSLPNGKVNQSYSAPISVSGATSIKLSFTGGSPGNMSLVNDNGQVKLAGTPTYAGTFNVTINASNGDGYALKTLKLVIEGAPSLPTINTASLPNGKVNESYSAPISVSGPSPITVYVSGIPAGLDFVNGSLTGKPTTAGTYNVTVKATNNAGTVTKNLTLTVTGTTVKPVISTSSLPDGKVNQSYTATINITGSAPMNVSVSGFPKGLNFSNGTFTGKPIAAGSYNVTVTAVNSAGSTTKVLKMNITGESAAPSVETNSLPDGKVNESYNASLVITGSAPMNVSVAGLPAGLTISNNSITGKPTASGTYKIVINASNNFGTVSKTLTLNITGNAVPPVIGITAFPDGKVNESYSADLRLSGTLPMMMNVSGLPPGIELSDSGILSGKPTYAGTFNVTIKVSNSAGNATKTLRMNISGDAEPTPASKPAISASYLPDAKVGEYYSADIGLTGSLPMNISITGMPQGFSFSSGILSGYPQTAGNYNVTITASNSAGNVTKTLPLKVTSNQTKPVIGISSLPAGKVGAYYSADLKITGTAPIKISVSGIPAGLTITPSGVLSGYPKAPGTYNVTVKVSDMTGNTSKTMKMNITAPKTIPNAKTAVPKMIGMFITGNSSDLSYDVNNDGIVDGRDLIIIQYNTYM